MIHHIYVIASYTVLEAIRNRLLWLSGGLITIAIIISMFSGTLALTESSEFQIAAAAFILRTGTIIIASLTVISGTIRDYNDKNHELVLSTAITRSGFFFGRLSGYLVIASLIAIISTLPLLFYADITATVIWMFSLILETCLISALALVLALVISNLTISVIIVLVFYILARSMPAILQIAHSPAVDQEAASTVFISGFIDLLNYLLPDLGRFTHASWLYESDFSIKTVVRQLIQTGIYIVLLSGMALIDFNRKNI